MDWRGFFQQYRTQLESYYPGITETRFIREAEEIGGDGTAFLAGVPFAYQLGYAEFAGFDFKVTEDTLIPRPETEQLFEKVSEEIKRHPAWKRLLDVGTGSGCLGLALAKTHTKLNTTLSDISPAALKVAETNAFNLSISAQLIESDLLTNITGLYDVVVSNPPYIPRSASGVHAMTDLHEPHLALYVADGEYEKFFKRLFAQVAKALTADGMFFMEGHEEKLQECAQWAREAKLTNVQVLKDWSERERFLVASAPRAPIG